MSPGHIEPYEAGLLIAKRVWKEARYRSDAMVFMRIRKDDGRLRGDWEPDYPPGKGEVLLADVNRMIKDMIKIGTGRPTGSEDETRIEVMHNLIKADAATDATHAARLVIGKESDYQNGMVQYKSRVTYLRDLYHARYGTQKN